MKKYWYFSAQVFSNDQSNFLCCSNGTAEAETFPLSYVVKETAKKLKVHPRCVAINFFTEISCEEFERYNALRKED